MKYADDPALAIVEVQNEDDVFFWNPLNTMATRIERELYAPAPCGVAEALAAMGEDEIRNQYCAAGCVGQRVPYRARTSMAVRTASMRMDMKLYSPWEPAGHRDWPRGRRTRRPGQPTSCVSWESCSENYYASRIQQIRDTGFQGVTVTTNWIVGENGNGGGSSARAANLWADQAGDAIDRA